MFMTPREIRRCSSEELTRMLTETENEYKYWRKLARVRDAVSAHRLEQMRDLLFHSTRTAQNMEEQEWS